MTSSETPAGFNPSRPRTGPPAWAWCIAACALLPLVVFAAIAVIALPTLRRMREAFREAGRYQGCLSNVQQLARGAQMYAQDYDDHLPAAANWMDAEAPYMQASGTKERPPDRCPTATKTNPSAYGYAFNTIYGSKPYSKIATPSTAQFVYDSSNLGRNASDPVTSLPKPGRHQARMRRARSSSFDIMGYADGHAKAVTEQGKTAHIPGVNTADSAPDQ